jgi:hypothetical protein
VNANISLGRIL